MSILFIDTETTGFPSLALDADDPGQARVVQFAAILTDDKGIVKAETSALVSNGPDFAIPESATAIHGITSEDARNHPEKAVQQ